MKNREFWKMLFDEEGGTNGGTEGNNNDNNGKDNDNGGNDGKKYTDADVNAIIDKKFAELQKKAQAKVDEATKLANMNAEEKAKEWEKKYNELLAENTKATLTVQATNMLTADGVKVPAEIVSVLVGEDAETTNKRVNAFSKAFKTAVQEAIKDANKKPSPKTGGSGKTLTKADILKVEDVNERQKLIRENINLFR